MKKAVSLILITVLTFTLFPHRAEAAIVFDDTTGAVSAAAASSLTFSHTVAAGSNLVLVVGVSLGTQCNGTEAQAITSVKYNNVAMTEVTNTNYITECGGAQVGRIAHYVLANPSTGANNVEIVLAGALQVASRIESTASSFSGVDQTTPVITGHSGTAVGNSTTASLTITTASGEIIVDHVCSGNTVTSAGANQTEQDKVNTNTDSTCNNRGASTQAGADGGAMTWTVGDDLWMISAVSLNPAGAAAATKKGRMTIMGKLKLWTKMKLR